MTIKHWAPFACTLLVMASCDGKGSGGGNVPPPNVQPPVAGGPIDPDNEGSPDHVECVSYKNGEELASNDSYLELLSKVISNSNPEEAKDAVSSAEKGLITCK